MTTITFTPDELVRFMDACRRTDADVKEWPAWMDSPADVQRHADAYVDTVDVPSTDVVYYNNGVRKTYCVTRVNSEAIACTCPDFHFRKRVCKHMVAVGTALDQGDRLI